MKRMKDMKKPRCFLHVLHGELVYKPTFAASVLTIVDTAVR
jgi:hypothetical protein